MEARALTAATVAGLLLAGCASQPPTPPQEWDNKQIVGDTCCATAVGIRSYSGGEFVHDSPWDSPSAPLVYVSPSLGPWNARDCDPDYADLLEERKE